jgi:hypothetical protein
MGIKEFKDRVFKLRAEYKGDDLKKRLDELTKEFIGEDKSGNKAAMARFLKRFWGLAS